MIGARIADYEVAESNYLILELEGDKQVHIASHPMAGMTIEVKENKKS